MGREEPVTIYTAIKHQRTISNRGYSTVNKHRINFVTSYPFQSTKVPLKIIVKGFTFWQPFLCKTYLLSVPEEESVF